MKPPFSVRPYGEMLLLQDARGIAIAPFHANEKALAFKFAAAPDLYAAVEHAVAAAEDAYGDCGGYAIDIRECRAALAKARGKA